MKSKRFYKKLLEKLDNEKTEAMSEHIVSPFTSRLITNEEFYATQARITTLEQALGEARRLMDGVNTWNIESFRQGNPNHFIVRIADGITNIDKVLGDEE